ncbi:MAG: M20/M25/M40 family metallo-hydrolase [Nitritalea sp.]
MKNNYYEEAVRLLKTLIQTPSFSREEGETARHISHYLSAYPLTLKQIGHNILAFPQAFDPKKATVLLNSHHDTVRPNAGYTRDPFSPAIEDGRLFGLGSNDAGGPLVSLIATFLTWNERGSSSPFNVVLAATAEEEISGTGGIQSILSELPACEIAIVGEPTLLKAAVAEKGLVVLDATVYGKAGHAAREEGENALYKALEDLLLIRSFEFKKTSPYLGKSKVSATVIQAGSQHNVVPDRCTYTLDVRVTDAYKLEEIIEELRERLKAELVPRSLRLNSSKLPLSHPMHRALDLLRIEKYGSPTLSDQALIPFPSVKLGPGDSARSHTADEFIYLHEIEAGISRYVQLLDYYQRVRL